MNLWCEVDKSTLKQNILQLKRRTNKKVISVVKANAYGLGIIDICNIIKDDTDMFGVSTLEEANLVPKDKDVLIMTPICEIPQKPKINQIYTVDSLDNLSHFNKNEMYRVHLYIDSGMNRLGIKDCDLDDLIFNINTLYPNIKIEGIYTHLHNTKNIAKTKEQILLLQSFYIKYKDSIKWFHCLNSNGVLNDELLKLADFTNIVRTGNLIYGFVGNKSGFKKAFKIKARVTKKYVITENGFIGYNAKDKVKKGTIVGVLPIGSIDKIGLKKDTKNDFLLDLARLVKSNIHKRCYISYDGQNIRELCSPNMNCTLIDISNIDTTLDIIVELNLSPILSDSSIPKLYI